VGKVGIRDDKFKLRPDSELYIACEKFDFSFFLEEVEQIKQSYKQGGTCTRHSRRYEKARSGDSHSTN